MAMRFDVEEMTAAFGDANDFDSVTRGMTNVGLDPWYTYGDERYFNVLNNSGTANFQWDMSLLYDRYYDRAETLDAVRNSKSSKSQRQNRVRTAHNLRVNPTTIRPEPTMTAPEPTMTPPIRPRNLIQIRTTTMSARPWTPRKQKRTTWRIRPSSSSLP